MDAKEDGEGNGEGNEDQPSSPVWVLQQISEEAFRVAGEALQNVYSGNSSFSPLAPGHRRAQSEIGTTGHRRSNSLQRLKSHVQRAWRWGSSSREDGARSSFNPEVMANQKRQWYQLHPKAMVLDFYFIWPVILLQSLGRGANLLVIFYEKFMCTYRLWPLQSYLYCVS